MRAVFHNLHFQEHDATRGFRLEVQIGGEVFYEELTVSKMEVARSFGINENIKRCLIERFLEKQRRDIHKQIGIY